MTTSTEWPGAARQGLVGTGKARSGGAGLGAAWHGKAGRCPARQGLGHYPHKLPEAWRGPARSGGVGQAVASRGAAWRGEAEPGQAWTWAPLSQTTHSLPVARHGEAGRGGAWYGLAWLSRAGLSVARQGLGHHLIRREDI